MKTFLILTIVQTISLFSYGFILPVDVILKKHVALNGAQAVSLEQDVSFKDGAQEYFVHESWLIENDRNLKLTATGLGELKDSLKIVAVYNGKNRTTLVGKNRITEVVGRDFFEKYLFIRNLESYKKVLGELNIEPSVRLARSSGRLSFALGEPSTSTSIKPQLWISQDSFQLSKIRFPSEAEIVFDDYVIVNPLFNYPKTKTLDWAGKSIVIKVRSVSDKVKAPSTAFNPHNIDTPSEMILAKNSVSLMIEEFYKRFR